MADAPNKVHAAGISALSIASNTTTLVLANSTTTNQPSVTLTAQNANKISNLKFNGLDNYVVTGREVSFNSSSDKNSTNKFREFEGKSRHDIFTRIALYFTFEGY